MMQISEIVVVLSKSNEKRKMNFNERRAMAFVQTKALEISMLLASIANKQNIKRYIDLVW